MKQAHKTSAMMKKANTQRKYLRMAWLVEFIEFEHLYEQNFMHDLYLPAGTQRTEKFMIIVLFMSDSFLPNSTEIW